MNPRTQLIMWTSILLALFIILLDKLYEGPPSVIKDRDTLAGIGQEELGLAGAFSEGAQIRDSADLNQKSSVEYESQFDSPPITRAVSHDSTHIYVIQEYDTLGKIAQQYNLDVATLLRFNEIRDPDKIHTGQKLQIPLQQDIYYVVKRTDNLVKIAQQYGVSVNQIIESNTIGNEDLIHTGAKLRIHVAELLKQR